MKIFTEKEKEKIRSYKFGELNWTEKLCIHYSEDWARKYEVIDGFNDIYVLVYDKEDLVGKNAEPFSPVSSDIKPLYSSCAESIEKGKEICRQFTIPDDGA